VTSVDLSLEERAQRVFARTIADAATLFRNIDRTMAGLGYPLIDRSAVGLVLREAFVNAQMHSHAGDLTRPVRVTYAVRNNEVVVEIEDDGPGFDPATLPHPTHADGEKRGIGWGLFWMRSYSTWLAIDPPGNRVRFGRARGANSAKR
jgi:anti-sigma regulatory factor (Ser/Thr protein kinase)